MLTGHTQDVRDVVFDERDATVAYSASLDHSVKTWDLPTSRCVDTKSTNQSLMALCHLAEHSLVATGGALRYIDLVDLRASATKVSAMQCSGHTNWIRSITRDPNDSNLFVSASDDSTCRIWDIRSTTQEAGGGQVAKPVYVIERVSVGGAKQEQGGESTVYSVAWDKEVGVVSAGKEKMLQVNQGLA
jgi:ribosome biogenesis protein YTM1